MQPNNIVIFCISKFDENICMLQPWQQGKVIKIENESLSVKKFFIQAESPAALTFKPGQFVTLDLPIHEQKNKRWRSYSVASWPDGSNVFELLIVLVPGGAGSTYLFENVQQGGMLTYRGPQGVFVLPEVIDKPLYLICTGTGIAPFRSMVQYMHLNNIPHKEIYLIFGCRNLCDSLYRKELQQLQQQMPGFKYLPVFSREAESVTVKKGYVHPVYETLYTASPTESLFYLCGWKNMIDEAKERILQMGIDKKNIHLELYG